MECNGGGQINTLETRGTLAPGSTWMLHLSPRQKPQRRQQIPGGKMRRWGAQMGLLVPQGILDGTDIE